MVQKEGNLMLLYQKGNDIPAEVTLRAAQRQDAPQIISCIRDAYGETYVKPFLYTEEGILHHEECGELRFSVAENARGELAGITAYERSEACPGLAEIACQVIRREYNGYGLALPLALHAMHRAEELPLTGQFARALGCHLISQKTLKNMGFTACGFLLNIFNKEIFLHRFENGDYAKIPQSVAVKRQGKSDAGAVWVPEALVPLARDMYQSLGMTWSGREAGPLSGEDVWSREEDNTHATLALWARSCGAEFPQHLAEELSSVKGRSGQTVNLYLNLTCPGSSAAYEVAVEQGFFATGFLPCVQDGEYLIMHHPLDVPVILENIPYIPEYAPFMEQIRRSLWKIQ